MQTEWPSLNAAMFGRAKQKIGGRMFEFVAV
jgi:hypothetical protein